MDYRAVFPDENCIKPNGIFSATNVTDTFGAEPDPRIRTYD
jgi:hypothetical protein